MKIALVAMVENKGFGRTSWIGLGYLYSALKNEFDIQILYYNFDEVEQAVNDIIEQNFELIGVSILQFNYTISMYFCELLKNKNPDICIVAGNIIPSLYPDKILKKGNIDYIIIGEGEETFYELCQLIKHKEPVKNCRGIVFVHNNKIIFNEPRDKVMNLDKLNFPTRLPTTITQTAFGIVGSRGCDGTCTFCDSKIIHGSIVRTRSMSNIIQEIRELIETRDCKIISFYDSTFCTKSDKTMGRLHDLYNYIKESRLKFYFDLNIRSEQFGGDLLDILEKLCSVGLFCLLVGFESGNDQDLKLYGKPSTVKDHYAALNALEKINFFPNNDSLYIDYGFINFNPYTTIDKLYQNVEFLLNAKLDVTPSKLASRLLISGGAPICKKIINDGLLRGEMTTVLTDPIGYNFEQKEIQKIYDALKYCIGLIPNAVNPEFMPHFILYKNTIGDHQVINDFKYYRQFMHEYTGFSIDLFIKILNHYESYNDINKKDLIPIIEKFCDKNKLLMNQVKAYQLKIYVKMKKAGILINY